MLFLTRAEAQALEKKLRRQIAEQPKPKLALHYDSGKSRDYASAAHAIAASVGTFAQAMVLFQFCVTGDGWNEDIQHHEGWRAYRTWRTAAGETSRLYDAPGHQFDADEPAQLARLIHFALELGWDALIAATPKRQLAFLSHDDRMEIYRGFDRCRFAAQLIGLGYWRAA
jgi:hypothetical protein